MRVAIVLMLLVILPAPLWAETTSDLDHRIWESSEVIREFNLIPENSIPPELLRRAKAIAVFPNMVKVGFVVAAQFGKGVVIYRDEATGQWSAPAFFNVKGGSIGFQLGGQATDIILVVTSERGVQAFLKNKFTIGADAAAAAGPVGRKADAKTDWKLTANILSYSRSRGLFAGVSLEGVVVSQDEEANARYYGLGLSAEDILMDKQVKTTEQGRKLIEIINSVS